MSTAPHQCTSFPGECISYVITPLQALVHIAQRLEKLHQCGWVHRDLKPGNILRLPRDHSWTLMDFGCAARIGTACFPSHGLRMYPSLMQ